MSFELAVWHEPKPITREHAEDVFQTFRHGKSHGVSLRPEEPGASLSGEQEPAETHPGVVAFVERLPEAEPLSADFALVTVDLERADEVAAEVFALAAECGLVCYDPQRGLVHNLSPRGVYPTMEMRTGDGMIVVAPDLGLISDALATMSPQNPFTALVVFGEHFVQSSPEISGYELEYKDSVRDRMFRTHIPDLEAVQTAFIEYATGERAFLERHDWRLV
ncbi:hypothetical protein OG884_24120 [Streptosporangium sp. NBC_01755]|uniref:hypothetical protein n=1 Tax=unclassified Streptosporangium TaxID=2632669 RepID=UPI002DDA9B78|nr:MULTISPECIES: hypothetical protein [unclassified Streptosporangium]WSA23959.1 hypothetical protein OIE13_23790 [Streptosporangium sp. NBC_01810]WSC97966.1 hypothetical protein OG884_24120 [Streptosporangium sp. NBC_01755]